MKEHLVERPQAFLRLSRSIRGGDVANGALRRHRLGIRLTTEYQTVIVPERPSEHVDTTPVLVYSVDENGRHTNYGDRDTATPADIAAKQTQNLQRYLSALYSDGPIAAAFLRFGRKHEAQAQRLL